LMQDVMFDAAKHNGTAVVEFLQNCIIFNDKTHQHITNRENAADNQLILRNGEPMIFGKEKNKGIRLGDRGLEVVTIGKNGITEQDILVHDAYQLDAGLHLMLAKMRLPEFPVALGVIRSATAPTYDQLMEDQISSARATSKIRRVDDLLNSGDVWEI